MISKFEINNNTIRKHAYFFLMPGCIREINFSIMTISHGK